MIFFWLSLIALLFCLLGFFLHAFYFDKQQLVLNLRREIESVKKVLATEEEETRKAWEEISKTRTVIHSLREQLKQENVWVRASRCLAMRQEKNLHLPAADDRVRITPALPATEHEPRREATLFFQDQSTCKPDVVTAIPDWNPNSTVNPRVRLRDGKGAEIPLWKENLHNILSTLDTLEKEGDR
jgi:hypothetical protein